MTSALRILQVTTDDDRRGGQIFATDLHAGLAALGHKVDTVALAPGTTGGLELRTLGPARRHPRTIRELRRRIRLADVVVGHGSTTLPACAIAGAGTGVPFVYRQISDSHFWANTPARRCRVRLALRRARCVVALWHGAAKVLTDDFGVGAGRIVDIPNGVPAERFAPPSVAERAAARSALEVRPDQVVVAYVGALAPEKGVDLAIDALADRQDAVLVVAGDGVERPALMHQARVLDAQVRFLGSVVEPRDVYAAADVVVLPSRGGDSMPAMLIEAGMMGIPAVSTTVAAIPEIVVDGRGGLVTAPDDMDQLRVALDRICADADLRAGFGPEARRRCVERFSIGAVATAWSEALEAAVEDAVSVTPLGRPDDGAERRRSLADQMSR